MELIWENGTHLDCYDNKPGQHGWCGVCDPNAKSGEKGFCNSADSLNLKVCSLTTVTYSRLTPFPLIFVKSFSTNFGAFCWFCYNQRSFWLPLKEATNASATKNWGWCDHHCQPHCKDGHYHTASKLQVARVDILDDPDCVSFNLNLQFYLHKSQKQNIILINLTLCTMQTTNYVIWVLIQCIPHFSEYHLGNHSLL